MGCLALPTLRWTQKQLKEAGTDVEKIGDARKYHIRCRETPRRQGKKTTWVQLSHRRFKTVLQIIYRSRIKNLAVANRVVTNA